MSDLMSLVSFDEIIASDLWTSVDDSLKHMLLYETMFKGVLLDDILIARIDKKYNQQTKKGKKIYENKACRFLKNELSNTQRKQAKIDDSTWRSWAGMVSNVMLHS